MVTPEGVSCLRAVFQPTTSLSWQNMRRQVMDLGELPMGQYLYLGPEDIKLAQYLICGDKVFLPRRCDPIRLGNRLLCYWGLCVPAGEEEAWNS